MCALGSFLETLPETCPERRSFLLHSILRKVRNQNFIVIYCFTFLYRFMCHRIWCCVGFVQKGCVSFCAVARCDPQTVQPLLTLFFWFLLLRAWSSTFIFTSQLFFLSSLCSPSDASSSSKRLMPAFWVRDCRPELSQLDGAVLADVLSPIRSTRAEPGCGQSTSVYDLLNRCVR